VDVLLRYSGTEAPFDRVVVETTGFADPTPIVTTLVRHPELSQRYHLDAVVTAVDAEHAVTTLATHDEAKKQVILADDLVMTKIDVVGASALHAAREAAQELNPWARLFTADRGLLDWRPILEWTPSTVSSRLDIKGTAPPHGGAEVRSFFVRVDDTVAFRSFALWLSMVKDVVQRATLTLPTDQAMRRGGRRGFHTESLGHMLATMQIVARSHPGASW
jgi:G3E family GTPase